MHHWSKADFIAGAEGSLTPSDVFSLDADRTLSGRDVPTLTGRSLAIIVASAAACWIVIAIPFLLLAAI